MSHEAHKRECLACGRRVIWATHRVSGKRIAVDPDSHGQLGTLVVIDSGRQERPLLYVETYNAAQHGSTPRRRPHAETCRGKAGRVWTKSAGVIRNSTTEPVTSDNPILAEVGEDNG